MSNLPKQPLSWLDKAFVGYSTIQSAGTSVAQQSTVDFVGAVSVVDDPIAGRTIVTLPTGGPASAYTTVQSSGTSLTQRSTVDFVGAGVTCSDDAAHARTLVTIAGPAITFLSASGFSATLAPGAGQDTDCAFSSLTANGAVALPVAPTKGQRVRTSILDASGLPFSITITAGAGSTIGNALAATYSLSGAGCSVEIVFDGVASWWVRQTHCPLEVPIDGDTSLRWLLGEATGATTWANDGTAAGVAMGTENLYGGLPKPRNGGYPLRQGLDFQSQEIGTAATSSGESASDLTLILTMMFRSQPGGGAQLHLFGKRHANDTLWAAPQISAGLALNNGSGGWRAYFTQTGGTLDSLDDVIPFTAFNAELVQQWALTFVKSTGVFTMYLNGDLAASKVGAKGAGVGIDWGTHGAWYMGGIPTGNSQCFDGIMRDCRVLQKAVSQTYLKTLWNQSSGQLGLKV